MRRFNRAFHVRSIRLATVFFISVSALGWGYPLRAAVAECLWDHLPSAAQDAIYAAYEADGLDGLDRVGPDNSQIEQLYAVCSRHRGQASVEELGTTGFVLVGISLEKSAAHHIGQSEGVTAIDLLNAWRGLPENDRGRLRQAYLATANGDSSATEGVSLILDRAVKLASSRSRLGVPPSRNARYLHYANFFLGIAQSEAFENQL